MQNLLSLADQHTPEEIVSLLIHALQTKELTLSTITQDFLSRLWYRENQQVVFPLLVAQLPMEESLTIINFLRSLPGQEEGFVNVFLAAECLRIVREKYPVMTVDSQPELYWQVKKLASYGNFFLLLYQSGQDLQKIYQIRIKAVQAIARTWQDHPETENWLKSIVNSETPGEVRAIALQELLNKFPSPRINWLKKLVVNDVSPILREAAILELSKVVPALDWQFWQNLIISDYNPAVRKTSLETLVKLHPIEATAELLRKLLKTDENQGVRTKAMELLGRFYRQDSDTLATLKAWLHNGNRTECLSAITIAVDYYPELPGLSTSIKDLVLNSSHVEVQQKALQALSIIYPVEQLIPFCLSLMTEDTISNLRETIVNLLAQVAQAQPDILAYLQNVAESDPDIMVREATVKAIAENWCSDQSIRDFLRKIADHDPYWLVQQSAVKAIAYYGRKTPDTLCWLQDIAVSGSQLNVREVAVQEIVKGWGYWDSDPNVQTFLQNLAEQTTENNLVNVIIQAIAKNWGDQPAIAIWLENWLNSDQADVRQTILQSMFYTETSPAYQVLEHHATADNSAGVRQLALQKLARYHHDHINTLETIKKIAKTDSDARVRVMALVELLRGWKEYPGTFDFFCYRAVHDPYNQNDCFLNNPRFTALEILIEHYADQSKTIQIVQDRAINDTDEQIRGLAQKKLE